MKNGTDDETHSSVRHPERAEGGSSSNHRWSQNSPSLSNLKRVFAGVAISLWTFVRPNAVTTAATDAASAASSDSLGMQSDGQSPVTANDDSARLDIESRLSPPDADHPLVGVDPELLNPERRILQLLIVEGGALPQSELVERTRWSDSTISRTLCRMETQERIERHRKGTGKLVVLPQNRES